MYCCNYFMKSSHMALISMENMTVGFLHSPVHPCLTSCSKICMTVVSLLQSPLILAKFSSCGSLTGLSVDSCPRMSPVSRTSGVCCRRDRKKRFHLVISALRWSLDGIVFPPFMLLFPPLACYINDSPLSHATNMNTYPDLNLSIQCWVFCCVSCCKRSQ